MEQRIAKDCRGSMLSILKDHVLGLEEIPGELLSEQTTLGKADQLCLSALYANPDATPGKLLPLPSKEKTFSGDGGN